MTDEKPPVPGKVYRHHAGMEYSVLCIAALESDPEKKYVIYLAVVQQAGQPKKYWARELENWTGEVSIKVPRFKEVG